jgi:Ca-activated chloride channel family protein
MWERLQREAKMAIAKRAIGELVTGLPSNVRLGLVVYSHRRGNSCGDLELLVPPGPLDAGALVAAVDPLRPNGARRSRRARARSATCPDRARARWLVARS